MPTTPQERLPVPALERDVGVRWHHAQKPMACYVFAHGAGAGMDHPWNASMAKALANAGVSVCQFQFPYVDDGKKAPNRPPILEATVEAAWNHATEVCPDLPLYGGGKSMGGRISTHCASRQGGATASGLILLGFPLHAAKKPKRERGEKLKDVGVPMLFIQGTRDTLADPELVGSLIEPLPTAEVVWIEGGDHSFKIPKRLGVTEEETRGQVVQHITTWIERTNACTS